MRLFPRAIPLKVFLPNPSLLPLSNHWATNHETTCHQAIKYLTTDVWHQLVKGKVWDAKKERYIQL